LSWSDNGSNLEGVVDALQNSTSLAYDSFNNLTQVVNARGLTTTYSYDELDRLFTVTDAESNTTTYQYDGLGNQVALIDAEEVRTTYLYDGLNRLVGVIENDTGGSPTAESNVLTQYLYDAIGNRLVITNALSYSSTLTTYNALNRPVVVEDALGNRSYSQYNALGYRTVITDANGAVTLFGYDGLNRPLTTTYTADQQVVTYAYDAAGNRTLMSDELGVTTYQYDTLYRLVTVTNPFSGTVGYGYDLAGNRTRLVYPDHREVIYTYDGDYRMVQVEDWAEGLTSYAYDAAGRLITTTLPNGVISVNNYDAANRLTRLAHEESGSETLLAEFLYQLDGVGNRVVATETVRAPGPLQALADILVSGATSTYDQTSPAVVYNGEQDEYLVVWQTEERKTLLAQRLKDGELNGDSEVIGNGFHPAVAYSSLGGAYLAVWDDGEDIWAVAITVTTQGGLDVGTPFLVYNATSLDPAGYPVVTYSEANATFLVAWQKAPDPLGIPEDLIQARSVPLSGAMGSVVTVTSQRGELTETAVAADTTGGYLVVWHDTTDVNIYGQMLDSGSNPVGRPFAVDGRDIVTERYPAVAWSDTGAAYLVAWQYGSDTIRARWVPTSGTSEISPITFNRVADAAYRPAVTAGSDGWLVAWGEYWATGPGGPTSFMAAQKVDREGQPVDAPLVASSGYAQVGQPAVAGRAERDRYLLVWKGQSLSALDPYRIAGTVLERSQILQTTGIGYNYDPLYRLTEAAYTGAITATYGYQLDAVGNRLAYTATLTTTQVTTYTYNAANQLVTAKLDSSPDTWYYEFDNIGNQVRQVPNGLTPAAGEVRYTFNQRNRLVRLESHDGNAYQLQGEARYDGDGQRVQTVAYMMGIPITTTYSLDRRSGKPLLLAGAGQETAILYGLFALGEIGSEWHYYLGDGQFSVRQLVNENGAPVLSRTYDPFGLVLQEAGSGDALFGFRGAQGGGMGLLYVGGRYYDPRTGRFLSPNNDNFDPRRPGTLNPYLSALFLLPLLLVIARKDRRRSKHIAIWLLGLSLVLTTTGCEPPKEEDDETSPPNPTEINTPPPTSTNTPTPTNTPPTPTASPSPTPGPTNTPSSTPSPTATCTPTPTATSTPTVTPLPTPPNLPPTSAGWRWEFVSSNVRTTQYSTDPLDVARFGGPLETPYGTNNQPISGVGELPNDFLRQVAYQGSGRLENGDLIQYAGPGAPIEPGWVPYRYFITPRTLCGGYPLAGNQTCAVPYETGAVALEPADRLVQVGVTVFIVELNLRIRINDTGSHVAPNQIDIYTGFHNDLNLYRHGLSVWRLVRT
jgi:RHS repeat-associated protein